MKILVFEGVSSLCEASPTKVLWRDALAGCSVLKYGCGLGAAVAARDALTGRSTKGLGGAAVGWVLWRMLWRGALLHKRSLRKGLEQEASKRPARG